MTANKFELPETDPYEIVMGGGGGPTGVKPWTLRKIIHLRRDTAYEFTVTVGGGGGSNDAD